MSALSRHSTAPANSAIGAKLREWRQRRRRSQLDLALDASVSQRHISFVESGRAQPSREMVMLLAEQLEIPLRERNALLLAAGFAPFYPEYGLEDPSLASVRVAVDAILRAHAPNPALAVDRHWRMVSANASVAPLTRGVRDQSLLKPPVNVLRLSLRDGGLAPWIANLAQWRAHILERLRGQIRASCDPILAELLAELEAIPAPPRRGAQGHGVTANEIFVPLELETEAGRLSLMTATTVFGTPAEVTVSELAIETFFPADEATAARLRALAQG
jgi:transcriptional regulator with XRE-family HTH domain